MIPYLCSKLISNMESQKKLAKILADRKELKAITPQTLFRWAKCRNSPSLKIVEEVCVANGIEPPFFFDGTIEGLVEYTKATALKLGLEAKITFET